MKKALIITVGTTLDPIIESITRNDVEVIYLVYGRPLSPDQDPNPFNVAYNAKLRAKEIGKFAIPIEISDPEDIDSCVSVLRELVKDTHEFDEIIVNFTGGTKPMSAAAFHVFLTEMISSKLIFEYVGGKIRNELGRVTRMETKKSYKTASDELARKVISYMEQYQFYLAKKLSEMLPNRTFGFLKKAAEAFWLWDLFEYEKAVRILNEIGKAAESLENIAFGQVPENVVKLRNISNIVVNALKKMRKCQNEKVIVDVEGCHVLSLDALVNAERRLKTHNYTEAVLRAYRAIEIATQVKLLENGINPWKVEWAKIMDYQELLDLMGYKDEEDAPKQLTLWNGLSVLDFLESHRLMGKIRDDLQFISQLRNNSKLEHGYSDISRENAEQVVSKSFKVLKAIIGSEDFPELSNLKIF